MSEQREGATATSLEEVFLSQEFGRASVRRVLTESRIEEGEEAPQLEQLFLSERFGRPQAVAARRPQGTRLGPVVPDDAVVTPLHPTLDSTRSETTRHRAIAAVSGVAAAALVVAGVAAGGSHTGHPTVSAQGERVSARPQPGGESAGSQTPVITSGAAPAAAAGATTVAQTGGLGSGFSVTGSGGPMAAASPSMVVAAPPGAAVTVISSPAPGAGGSPAPGGTGPSAPGPTPANPLNPAMAVVGTTVATAGATVTSTAGQVGSAVPTTVPVAGLLGGGGASLSGLGQALGSTTT